MIRLGQLEAQKSFLQTVGSYKGKDCDIDNAVSRSQSGYDGSRSSLEANSTNLMTKRCKCIVAGGDTNDADCTGFQGALDLSLENAQEVAFQFQGKKALEAIQSGDKAAVDRMIQDVDSQITALESQVPPPGLSEVGEAASGIAGGNAPSGPWLYFNWTSDESHLKEDSFLSSLSTKTSASYSAGLFSVGGSAGYSRDTENAFRSLKQNRVKVAGQIMRVTVQMPWFRPELFKNENLKLVSLQYSSVK